MKKILILGAGRSSVFLIEHLLKYSGNQFSITVADQTTAGAESKTGKHPAASVIALDVNHSEDMNKAVAAHDIVISMLPANMHIPVAYACLEKRKHLFTASYVSPAMQKLNHEVEQAGLLFMNELGLDPGIDHMSAMQMIEELKERGGEITSFKSFCGGLVSPKSNDNPWGYKFSWNPRNVILAGQSTARWLEQGKIIYTPYHRLFKEAETIEVPGFGSYDAYANRDSLGYTEAYGLSGIRTLKRGTIRQSGYCRAWDALVQMGITDDTFSICIPDGTSWHTFSTSFLPGGSPSWRSTLCKLMHWQNDDDALELLEYTGIFDADNMIAPQTATPAALLQQQLEKKWLLRAGDTDRIVMIHEIEYLMQGKMQKLSASLVIDGESQTHTAMAKTVGLPLAVFTRLFVDQQIQNRGVLIPVHKNIYQPVMQGLSEFGIHFQHTHS